MEHNRPRLRNRRWVSTIGCDMTMHNHDVKRAFPTLYAPRAGDFHVVEVPELSFLMIDGHGDPNTSPAYAEAVRALFTLSYAVRGVAKTQLDRVHTVGPLEGLWSADDPGVFRSGEKGAWDWTMMIWQPSWISTELIEAAIRKTGSKGPAALARVRLDSYAEGTCVQILHIGPYDAEAPVLARLHDQYLPDHGLTFNGRHHEIYLSDARRTAPARLRTILRQPVTRADAHG